MGIDTTIAKSIRVTDEKANYDVDEIAEKYIEGTPVECTSFYRERFRG